MRQCLPKKHKHRIQDRQRIGKQPKEGFIQKPILLNRAERREFVA
jgi:hypothetical protein